MLNKKIILKVLIVIIFGITSFIISVNKSHQSKTANEQYINNLNIQFNGIVKNTYDLGHYSSVIIVKISESNYTSFNDTNNREQFLGIINDDLAKICISESGFIKIYDSISIVGQEYQVYRNKELIGKLELNLPSSTEYYNLKDNILEMNFN